MLFQKVVFICFFTTTLLCVGEQTVGYRTVCVAKNASRRALIDQASDMFVRHHERLVDQLCQRLNFCDTTLTVELAGEDALTVRATVSGRVGSGELVTLTLAESFNVVRFG